MSFYGQIDRILQDICEQKKVFKNKLSPYLWHAIIRSEENVVLYNIKTEDGTTVVYVLFCSEMVNRTLYMYDWWMPLFLQWQMI